MTGVLGRLTEKKVRKSQTPIDADDFPKKHRRFEIHRPNQNWCHPAIGRLEPNIISFGEVVFHRGFVTNQGHNHIAAIRSRLLSDEDIVPIEDPGFDH